ncbi:SDR family oxidoreductase [Chitinophagaceae bacterium LB-8]|uniref:SDR family oxidoreductase n=1 Tax=Paraflavisolibacter caeni TaxID=2982496 RepID=A0A9X2Y007_9BACT|nr:SDR family oxidoreductase [Paraflavisolibacter caeni]MCU7552076.1 SDR family oxidoreductase [Paraflavisolibacter caeni]
MKRLNGKVAIVTGGATGIGEAISRLFAKEGAKVIVNGFPEDPVMDVVSSITNKGDFAAPFVGDVSVEENAMACVQFAIQTFYKLDILINNAGVFPVMEQIHNYPTDAFDYVMRNNIRTAFLMTKYAIPELKKTKGCIVSAGSEAGFLGLAENAPYGGSKGWIHAFTRGVAVEQAQHGIRANCVCPGAIDTAWTHKEHGPMKKKHEKMIIEGTPLGRRGTPEEIANAYLFLASDEASYVTGALFSVDGGITIAKGAVGKMADKDVKKEPEDNLDLKHDMDGATDMIRGR